MRRDKILHAEMAEKNRTNSRSAKKNQVRLAIRQKVEDYTWSLCNPKAYPFNRPTFLARKLAAGPINGVTFNALVG